jgi:hypothetical protein
MITDATQDEGLRPDLRALVRRLNLAITAKHPGPPRDPGSDRIHSAVLSILVLVLFVSQQENLIRSIIGDDDDRTTTAHVSHQRSPSSMVEVVCTGEELRFSHWFPDECNAPDVASIWAYWGTIGEQYPDLAGKLRTHVEVDGRGGILDGAKAEVKVTIYSHNGMVSEVRGGSIDVIVTDLSKESLRQLAELLTEAPKKAKMIDSYSKAHISRSFDVVRGESSVVRADTIHAKPRVMVIGSDATIAVDGPQYAQAQALKIGVAARALTISTFSTSGVLALETMRRHYAHSGLAARPPPSTPPAVEIIAIGHVSAIDIGEPRGMSKQSIEIVRSVSALTEMSRQANGAGTIKAHGVTKAQDVAKTQETNASQIQKVEEARALELARSWQHRSQVRAHGRGAHGARGGGGRTSTVRGMIRPSGR